MAKQIINIIGYVLGSCIFILIAFAVQVVAEDGLGEGGDIGDLAAGFGIAGVVLFGLGIFTGLIIFLNQRPPFQDLFKRGKVKMKIFFKIHHPLTLVSIAFMAFHSLAIFYGGQWNLTPSGFMVGWVAMLASSSLVVTGLLFPLMRDATRRKVMRYIHLTLMLVIVIFVGIHAAVGD